MIHTLHRRPFVALLSTAGLLGLIAITAGFGPLNPPAGVITGTAKPLSEVEPRIGRWLVADRMAFASPHSGHLSTSWFSRKTVN